jgi:hypothetical protein
MLWELVTGENPAAANALQIAAGSARLPPFPAARVDAGFAAVVDRAVAPYAKDRFPSAKDFRAALAAWLRTQPSTRAGPAELMAWLFPEHVAAPELKAAGISTGEWLQQWEAPVPAAAAAAVPPGRAVPPAAAAVPPAAAPMAPARAKPTAAADVPPAGAMPPAGAAVPPARAMAPGVAAVPPALAMPPAGAAVPPARAMPPAAAAVPPARAMPPGAAAVPPAHAVPPADPAAIQRARSPVAPQAAPDRAALIGRWRLAVDDVSARRRYGEHALELTAHGDLVQSTVTPGGLTRVLLTWRLEGDVLISDQPSAPHVERQKVALLPNGQLVLGDGVEASRYVRDDDTFGLDPEARLFALAGTALRHAVASAGKGGPFVPFLMTQTDSAMSLIRIQEASQDLAERAGRAQAGQLLSNVTLCAWTTDGMLALDGEQTDAAFTAVSRRGVRKSKIIALRYRFDADAVAQSFGGFVVVGESDGWLP